MLAKSVPDVPAGEYLYEPKWDGFRCIVFRDGDEVELGSRNEKPLTRYFPEVVAAVRQHLPERCVVDGEVVIAGQVGLDFEALLQRIHPADSRVQMLAKTTPASFVAFDLLALADEPLLDLPQEQRRERLEQALAQVAAPVHLTPATRDLATARQWFTQFEGAGLDGVMAKPRPAATRRTSGPCSRSSTPARPTAWSPATGCTRAVPSSGRWCWACMTTTALCSTSAWRRPSRWHAAPPRRRAGPLPGRPRRRHPAGEGASERNPEAGGGSRWNAGKDLSFVAAASGAGRRGRLRPHGGRALPAHRAVPALASGPGRGVVHLRSAGQAGPVRSRGGARRMTRSSPASG